MPECFLIDQHANEDIRRGEFTEEKRYKSVNLPVGSRSAQKKISFPPNIRSTNFGQWINFEPSYL